MTAFVVVAILSFIFLVWLLVLIFREAHQARRGHRRPAGRQ